MEDGQNRLFGSVGAPDDMAGAHRRVTDCFRKLGEQVEVDQVLEEGDVVQLGGTALSGRIQHLSLKGQQLFDPLLRQR